MTATSIRAGLMVLVTAATMAAWGAAATAQPATDQPATVQRATDQPATDQHAAQPATVQRAEVKPGKGAGERAVLAWIHLRNYNSRLCLAARVGSGEQPAVQTLCDYQYGQNWPDQHWEYVYTSTRPGPVRIRNIASGKCLAARGSGETGAFVTTCGSGTSWPDQIWRISIVEQWQADQIRNTASGNCLAARGSGESRAIVTTCNINWPDQHWY